MDFNNTGAMRSPFSPRVRQSISGRRNIGVSANKNQSIMQLEQSGDVIYKTPMMTMETYGPPLPVTVTEALTFSSGDISVQLSECGWCWVVTGRRILAWERDASAPARELTLPQTDLAHKADLVVIYYEDGAQMPSCIGVSPEGVVRYWASVGQETYADTACELAGQECDRLVLAAGRLVLATTTCSLVLLQPQTNEGRATVTCRMLRPPSGWLGGIGRRVSHLIFGAMPTHQDTKLVGVVGVGEAVALVAGGAALQVWSGAALERLHEQSLRRQLGEGGAGAAGALGACGAGERALLLLLGGGAGEPQWLARVCLRDEARARVLWVRGVRAWAAEVPAPLACGGAALLASGAGVALARGPELEVAQLAAEGDRLLGAAPVGERALLLTRKHGLLLLTVAPPPDAAPPSPCESPAGSPCPSDVYEGNLTLYEIDPDEVSRSCGDAAGQVQAALVQLARGRAAAAAALLQPLQAEGAALQRVAARVAARLLDDAPAGDARWRRARVALGASAALAPPQQLRDKRRALALLLRLLRAHAAAPEPQLRRLAERLAAASALADLPDGPDKQLVDDAMYQVICGSESFEEGLESDSEGEEERAWEARAVGGGGVSAREACLRRVSRFPRVLRALCRRPAAAGVLALALAQAHAVRRHWPVRAPCPPDVRLLRDAAALLPRTLKSGAGGAEAAEALAAALLEEAEPLQHAAHSAQLYADIRRDIIRPFLEAGQRAAACALAERHRDLELLVHVCLTHHDYERLNLYIDKYADEGICELAYAWLASRGGRHAAELVRQLGGPRLEAWLARAPARAPLLALLLLHAQRPADAARALVDASAQDARLPRARTAASLAKLCALAEPEPRLLRRLDAALDLCEQHAALPPHLARRHGLDVPEPAVHPPEDLMRMYIECDSGLLTECDYKKALELAPHLADDDLRDTLVFKVWCACILHSEWKGADEDDNMFSRLLQLVCLDEPGLEGVPRLDDIENAPELRDLVSDVTTHYRIKRALDTARAY